MLPPSGCFHSQDFSHDFCHHGNLLSNVSFSFGRCQLRCFVAVSHPRLEENEAECLEVNRMGIPDYSMYFNVGSIERTHKHFPH